MTGLYLSLLTEVYMCVYGGGEKFLPRESGKITERDKGELKGIGENNSLKNSCCVLFFFFCHS